MSLSSINNILITSSRINEALSLSKSLIVFNNLAFMDDTEGRNLVTCHQTSRKLIEQITWKAEK